MTAGCHSDDSVLSSFALFLIHEDSIIGGRSYKLNFICYFVWVWNLVSNMKGNKWRLTVLEKRVRRGIVWFKGKEVRGYWRKLLNDDPKNMIISRTMILSWVCSMHVDHEKKKGKGRLWVLQHCCPEPYCTLTRMSSFIHLQRRCTHQAAWETSASEGRNYTWNLASNL